MPGTPEPTFTSDTFHRGPPVGGVGFTLPVCASHGWKVGQAYPDCALGAWLMFNAWLYYLPRPQRSGGSYRRQQAGDTGCSGWTYPLPALHKQFDSRTKTFLGGVCGTVNGHLAFPSWAGGRSHGCTQAGSLSPAQPRKAVGGGGRVTVPVLLTQ